jgi:hypothetical protein
LILVKEILSESISDEHNDEVCRIIPCDPCLTSTRDVKIIAYSGWLLCGRWIWDNFPSVRETRRFHSRKIEELCPKF